MAGAPSPSGSSRRLSELLDEQQEPFSLDLYLLEKGCATAPLDAATGCSCATPTCWPRSSSTNTTRALRRPVASKKGAWASDVLRLLLSKILRSTAAAATAKGRQLQPPAAIDWRRVDGEEQRTPGSFSNALPPACAVEADTGQAEDDEEEEEDDDRSKKQLSPVSVLELHLPEQSPPAHAQKALVIFRELLHAAYTPTLLDLLANARSNNSSNSKDGRCTDISTPAPAPMPAPARKGHAHWDDLFEEELARVTGPIASDMASARVRPEDVRRERRGVGAAVAAAVLEALTEETASELMGMDHDCAVDTARW